MGLAIKLFTMNKKSLEFLTNNPGFKPSPATLAGILTHEALSGVLTLPIAPKALEIVMLHLEVCTENWDPLILPLTSCMNTQRSPLGQVVAAIEELLRIVGPACTNPAEELDAGIEEGCVEGAREEVDEVGVEALGDLGRSGPYFIRRIVDSARTLTFCQMYHQLLLPWPQ